MFRASACFAFIIAIFVLAATTAYLLIQAAGVSGLSGYILGLGIFTLILTALVMLLAMINDRINNGGGQVDGIDRSSRRYRFDSIGRTDSAH
jgi:predicted ferric reductase